MLLHFCLLAAQPDLSPIVLKPQVVDIAVFKPGLVLVAREAAVPSGIHLFALDHVPQGLDGTFWYSTSAGAKISEVRTTLNLKASAPSRQVSSIRDLLIANAGKTIRLVVRNDGGKESLAGKLLSFDPNSTEYFLRLPNGHIRSVDLRSIIEADTSGLQTRLVGTSPKVEMRFLVDASKPARVKFVSLESGAAWVANYRLDLHGKTGTLQAMAELGLGSLSVQDTRVRLVTGLPNLQVTDRLDLMSGSSSLSGYLNGTRSLEFNNLRDPYEVLAQSSSRPQGGVGGLVPEGVNFISYDPTDNSLVTAGRDSPQLVRQAVAASRLEDLHLFDFGKVTLPAGGRIARILSETNAPLETVYRWQVQSTNDVGGFMRTLRVHNDSKAPWPAGSVFVLSDNLPLAQISLPFTPIGQDANLVLGQAEDLLRTNELHEISREEIVPRPNVKTVAVTNEAVLNVVNTRDEPLEIEVVLEVAGQVTEAGGSKTIRFGIPGASNPQTRLTWRTTLAPGEKKTFTARYKENLM